VRVGSDGGREWNATMKSGLTLTELDQRIAAIRENLRELAEQAAADSGAGNEDLNAARIAEQEKALAELTELREASLRK
jgi:predicted mannosyl-3-phosphoglycerate phosphatase (HAD superfamily)